MNRDEDTVPNLKKLESRKNADADSAGGFGFHAAKDGDTGKLDKIDADQLSIADTARVFVGGKFQTAPPSGSGGFNPYDHGNPAAKKEPQVSIQSKNAKMKAVKQEKDMRYLDQMWGAGKK